MKFVKEFIRFAVATPLGEEFGKGRSVVMSDDRVFCEVPGTIGVVQNPPTEICIPARGQVRTKCADGFKTVPTDGEVGRLSVGAEGMSKGVLLGEGVLAIGIPF